MTNWAAHPILYQLTHWLHWLTYGQNTSALGLIGLGLYTYYTQRMMKAAEETRRLSLTPYLLADVQLAMSPPSIVVTNVAAPAVRCEVWSQAVSASFKLGFRLRRAPEVDILRVPAIVEGSKPLLAIEIVLSRDRNILYVIDCYDTAGGNYQLQLLQAPIGIDDEEIRIENCFVVPDTLFPLHLLVLNRLKQAWNSFFAIQKPKAFAVALAAK